MRIKEGTQVNYYSVCRRKLWLFSRNFEMERSSDLVLIGKLLLESFYPSQRSWTHDRDSTSPVRAIIYNRRITHLDKLIN